MPWINHLPPVCWSTFGILVWNDSGYVNLTQWWYFFIIFEYILHISTPHIMIFCFPLPYFPLSTSALFLLSTLVLRLYIDVVLSLSNIKMSSYQYRISHCGDKTVVRSSYLHNGISYTGKITSLYWIRAQYLWSHCRNPDSKAHGANMGPIWGWQDPCGHHVGPMNFAIWEALESTT